LTAFGFLPAGCLLAGFFPASFGGILVVLLQLLVEVRVENEGGIYAVGRNY
jgi:hypothetical protein